MLGRFEGVGDLVVVGCSHGVEELLGEEGLGFFGILDGLPHLLEEVVEPFFLLLEAPACLLALAAVTERSRLPVAGGVELFAELFLIVVQPPRLVPHLGQFLRKPIGCALAELIAELVQLAAGSCALGKGLGELALLQGVGCLANVLAALIELLSRFGHPISIFLAFHSLAHLVGIAEDLLLLFA